MSNATEPYEWGKKFVCLPKNSPPPPIPGIKHDSSLIILMGVARKFPKFNHILKREDRGKALVPNPQIGAKSAYKNLKLLFYNSTV